MEVFSQILKKTEDSGLLHGFHVGPVNSIRVRISHLLFANDTMLFCDASREQLLVAWEKVCSPLEMDGLGVRKLVHFNQALLGKWLWRFGQEGIHLWRRVIATKYREGQGRWNTKVCRKAHGCGFW